MKVILILVMATLKMFAFEDITPDTQEQNNKSNKPSIQETIDLDNIQEAYFKNDNDSIIVYKYDPMKIMKLRTRILTKTTVVLPQGDKPILNVAGSPGAFNIELVKESESRYDLSNTFTITASYVNTDTTLTIFGESGRIYNFYIYAVSTNSELVPNSTVFITEDGKIPNRVNVVDSDERDKLIIKLKEEINIYKEKLDVKSQKITKNLKKFNIANIQLDYKFNKKFNLEAVFNDDEYTYFKFKDSFSIPKFFYVDEKNDKINLNFVVFDNIVKLHKLSAKWSLELQGNYLDISKVGDFNIQYSHKKLFVDMTETKFNIGSISGDEAISPEIVFYDKKFTYFKFDMRTNFNKFPVVYLVKDGKDNPAQIEVINNYIVVKNLHDKFTLRSDKKHNCIRLQNEN